MLFFENKSGANLMKTLICATFSVYAIGLNCMLLFQYLTLGKLKAFRNGRTWRIPKQAVIDYVQGLT